MPVTPLDLPAAIVLIEGQKEQITTLTAQRDRLKRFWDTYAREVDKLAFEAQEEALEGAGDEEIVSLKESFRISSQLNEGLKEQIAALKEERDGLGRVETELRKLLQEWKKDCLDLTAENRRLRELCAELVGDDMKKEIE